MIIIVINIITSKILINIIKIIYDEINSDRNININGGKKPIRW
jgi:hypothetical protein